MRWLNVFHHSWLADSQATNSSAGDNSQYDSVAHWASRLATTASATLLVTLGLKKSSTTHRLKQIMQIILRCSGTGCLVETRWWVMSKSLVILGCLHLRMMFKLSLCQSVLTVLSMETNDHCKTKSLTVHFFRKVTARRCDHLWNCIAQIADRSMHFQVPENVRDDTRRRNKI